MLGGLLVGDSVVFELLMRCEVRVDVYEWLFYIGLVASVDRSLSRIEGCSYLGAGRHLHVMGRLYL